MKIDLKKTQQQEPTFASGQDLRKTLAGAKALSPLVNALLRNPGLTQNPEAMKEAAQKLFVLHQSIYDLVAEQVQPGDTHPAKKALLVEPLAHMLAEAWSYSQGSEIAPEGIANLYLQTIEMTEAAPDVAFEVLPRVTDEALMEAKAMMPCINTLMKIERMPVGARRLFVGQKDTMKDMVEAVRGDIEKHVDRVMDTIVPAEAEDRQKFIARQSVFNRISELAGTCLSLEYVSLGKELQAISKDADKKKAYMEEAKQAPRGVLFARVSEQVGRTVGQVFPQMAKARQNHDAEDAQDRSPSR